MRHGHSLKKHLAVWVEAGGEYLEYTDEEGHALLVGPRSESVRLGLRHRVAGVVLRDTAGRFYIRRRPVHQSFPGLWDLSALGHVRSGESLEDAAYRALQSMIHLSPPDLVSLSSTNILSGGEKLHVTLFATRPSREFPGINPEYASEGMFLDCDELSGLAAQFQELLTPALLWAIQNGLCPHESRF